MAKYALVKAPRTKGLVRSIWLQYRNAKPGWHVIVPLGLGAIAGATLTWAWTMLDRNEYAVAILLVLLFCVLGTGAAIAIPTKALRVIALSLVVIVAGFSGLKVFQEKGDKPWTAIWPRSRTVSEASSSPEPFSVQLSSIMTEEVEGYRFNPDRTVVTGFWMYDGLKISPIHVILLLRLINRQNTVSMVDAFNVEMEVGADQWVKLKRLNKGRVFSAINSIQRCRGFREAKAVEFERGFFEDAIRKKNIQQGETIEGWAFFQYPTEGYFALNPRRRYRLNMRLTSGASFTSIIPLGNSIVPEDAVQLVLLKVGKTEDLTLAAKRTYGDRVTFMAGNSDEKICP